MEDLFYLAEEISVELEMHSFADFVLKAEFGVDVVKGDFLVLWCFVADIIAMQRDVVQPVLFALGRLSVGWQEIYVGIIP